MKFEALNRRFSEIVAGYMAAGYYINAGTMSGTQGEVAHVDLTNGKEIIRVVMESFYDGWELRGIKIIVGRSTDRALPNRNKDFDTIWNNRLGVIKAAKYYEIGEDWYGTREEAEAKLEKHYARQDARRVDLTKQFGERAREAVLAYVKRQPKCKGAKLADITAVVKRCERGMRGDLHISYKVTAKGKTYTLR